MLKLLYQYAMVYSVESFREINEDANRINFVINFIRYIVKMLQKSHKCRVLFTKAILILKQNIVFFIYSNNMLYMRRSKILENVGRIEMSL